METPGYLSTELECGIALFLFVLADPRPKSSAPLEAWTLGGIACLAWHFMEVQARG